MHQKYMLIPGNPAIETYYTDWIKEIHKRVKNIELTYATSYVLFSRKLSDLEYNLKMRNYYENILLKLSKTGKVSVVAHSAGSYFALRLLEKYPEKIKKVVILYPYIKYSEIKSMRFLGIPYSIDRFFPLMEIVSYIKYLFHFFDGHTKMISSSNLTANLRFGIRQCVYFNRNEFKFNKFSKYKNKIYFIYTKNDRWCPNETIKLLKPISNNHESTIPHDFICYKNQRIKMIEEIEKINGF